MVILPFPLRREGSKSSPPAVHSRLSAEAYACFRRRVPHIARKATPANTTANTVGRVDTPVVGVSSFGFSEGVADGLFSTVGSSSRIGVPHTVQTHSRSPFSVAVGCFVTVHAPKVCLPSAVLLPQVHSFQ